MPQGPSTPPDKKLEREVAIKAILEQIESARKEGYLSNEVANLMTASSQLEGDEALFANRLISRGSDPASLELVWKGQISEPIMRAHTMGPGTLNDEERRDWLVLASISLDENSESDLPVTTKFKQFHDALTWLETSTEEEKDSAAKQEFEKIKSIPFEDGEVAGIKMRVYTSDRGFAAAYWSGEDFAAVKEGSLTFVGSKDKPLEALGIKVDKQLSPTFGIIFEK